MRSGWTQLNISNPTYLLTALWRRALAGFSTSFIIEKKIARMPTKPFIFPWLYNLSSMPFLAYRAHSGSLKLSVVIIYTHALHLSVQYSYLDKYRLDSRKMADKDKFLATFRIDQAEWKDFMAQAKADFSQWSNGRDEIDITIRSVYYDPDCPY